MRTVWKYPLNDGPISAPMGGRLVHIGHQNGLLMAWIEVDTEQEEREERAFVVVGTGHEIPAGAVHRYSWLDGPFVWHLYEAGS